MTELARVAGTHAAAVEERKESLLRAMEAANERIRRLNALVADAEVLARRAPRG
jgi:tetrahydromethanopterin S-methyltransferase subunit B